MSRKQRDPPPNFKGWDEDGEPMFAWPPEVPRWMREEYADEWKRTHKWADTKEGAP